MSARPKAFVVKEGEGRLFRGPVGGPALIKAGTDETGGTFAFLEVRIPPEVHERLTGWRARFGLAIDNALNFLNNPDGIQGHNFATQIAHVEDRRVLQGRLTLVRYNNEPQFFVADANVFVGLVTVLLREHRRHQLAHAQHEALHTALEERTLVLSAVECIDYLAVFDEPTCERILETLRPDPADRPQPAELRRHQVPGPQPLHRHLAPRRQDQRAAQEAGGLRLQLFG